MELHRHLESLTLLIFVLAAYFSTTLARHHRHHHGRHKRQHSPGSYVLDVTGREAGDWGPWSQPSPCSRSCGGGIASQTRQCREDTREPCEGATRRYFSCNIQDCPEGSMDFRSEQCAAYNAVPFDRVVYDWIPYTKGGNKCELNCMPRGERFYYRFKVKVDDGTRCDKEKLDVCVDGKCLPVGCDNLLGSPAREDLCRECGGDGSSCNTAKGLLDMDNLQVGYNDILLIPAGAMNIRVREIKASNNYLAIRNATGHYYLNGNWRIDYPRSVHCVGTIFQYERKPHSFFAPETLTALGPTTEAIYIVLLYQEKNPGIEYEYSIPKGAVMHTDPDSYTWIADEFQTCNTTCGGGIQFRRVWCAKRKDSSEVSSDLCDTALQPSSYQECALDPCPPQWRLSDWSSCSQTCGEGGTQTRQIVCEQIVSNGRASLVDSSQCENTLGPPPPSNQPCGVQAPCPIWHIGPWAPCDKLCGDGKQRRKITCYHKVDGKIEVLPDSACPVQKPEADKLCNIRPCDGVDWVVTEWSGCEDKCGLSFETRQAHCVTLKGEIYPDSFCPKNRVPDLVRKCSTSAPCKHEWFISQWSECSAQCGSGVQTRKVFCGTYSDEGVKKADDSKCDTALKFEATKNCTGKEECKGHWFSGPWNTCSKPCGGGVKSRKVSCIMDNKTVESTLCDVDVLIFSNEDCNKQACGEDQIIPIEPKQIIIEEEEEDECDYEDYALSFAPTNSALFSEGIMKLSSEMEGSGMASEESLFSPASKLSSDLSSLETDYMLSDAPSSYGKSDTTFSITYDEMEGSTFTHTDLTSHSSVYEGSGYSETTTSGSKFSESSVSDEITTGTEETIVPNTDISSFSTNSVTVPTDMILSTIDIFPNSDETGSSSTTDSSILSTNTKTIIESSSESNLISTSTSNFDLTTMNFDSSNSSSSSNSPDSSSENITPSSDSTTDSENSDLSTTKDDTTLDVSSSVTTESESESTSDSSQTISLLPITSTIPPSLLDTSSPPDSVFTGASESTAISGESSVSYTESIGSTVESALSTESSSESTESSKESTELTSEASESSSEPRESSRESSESSSESSESSPESSESSPDSSSLYYSLYSSLPESSTESTIESLSSSASYSTEELSMSDLSTTEGITNTDLSTTELGNTPSSLSSVSDMSTEGSTEEYIYSSLEVSTTEDIWSVLTTGVESTTASLAVHATTKKPKRTCKRKSKKKKEKCEISEFGCCYDNTTAAQGPFHKGCPSPQTCKDTKFGCCPDEVSPALGKDEKGCPPSQCNLTLFGCCPDGVSISAGNDYEGCPEEETVPPTCEESQFGCCPNGILPASGPDYAGCYQCEGSGDCDSCNDTKFGCCPDGISAAQGPDLYGCDIEATTWFTFEVENTTDVGCENTTYGCCPDGISMAQGEALKGCDVAGLNCTDSSYGCCPDGNTTALGPDNQGCPAECMNDPYGCCDDNATAAHGPNKEGCCLNTAYGCCPDNILPAQGANLEGCGCQYSPYGCCPDNKTVARGSDNQGCGCQYTPHGCCPNQYTPAAGPKYQGCPCHTYQFGCCPDGITRAIGPNLQGCGCENTQYGCCPDGRTPSTGPNLENCSCAASKYGCCPDGVSEAQGEHFENCEDIPLAPGELCSQPKDRGSCRNFTVKWFFDTEYGGCSRFWYGGCDGNENQFKNLEECKSVCVEAPGRGACYLPKIEGPCEGYFPTWYYDTDRKQCGQFIYGGCLGNNNRFETREDCQALCVTPDTLDACEQPKEEGPCQGNFTRWHYVKESHVCSEFNYGGCRPNKNNFLSEIACQQKCLHPSRSRVMENICMLNKDSGPCSGSILRWNFDPKIRICKQFVYGGCKGNVNRFRTEDECVKRCIDFNEDECSLPRVQGSCGERLPRWFFDASENRCMPFYYTGCEGNANRFETRQACETSCPPKIEQGTCLLPALVGECHNYTGRWYYDSYESQCKQFYYGGCGGNSNNFQSQKECQRQCDRTYISPTAAPPPPFTPDSCFLPGDRGLCSNEVAQWFYDSSVGVCKQFIYGGCEGNGNRFGSSQECEQNCGNVQDVCTLPKVVGPCNGNQQQWFYDKDSLTCRLFEYGGCQGNGNRFGSEVECRRRCVKEVPTEPATQGPTVATSLNEICNLPKDSGPCNLQVAAWFFAASENRCVPFVYGGCEGNANRFLSIEQCERQCGEYRSLDVCNEPVDVGPCVQQHRKWYYDAHTATCQEFDYGGCYGTANRFSTLVECESICLQREEPLPLINNSSSYLAICKLTVDPGPCSDGEFKRWYFNEANQTCVPFIYNGCAGNLNRFKSFQSCLDYCRPGSHIAESTVDPNEIDVDDKCQKVSSTCSTLTHCEYGVERWIDQSGCENCRCHNPCVTSDPRCPENTTCTVTLHRNEQTGDTEYRAICRVVTKEGECPQLSYQSSSCAQECNSDADCEGRAKCCYNGCGTSCVDPFVLVTQGPPPEPEIPGAVPPTFQEDETELEAEEGYYATLHCVVRGTPTPTITWIHGGSILGATGGKYKFLLDGSLQIIGLVRSDAGIYVCSAENGVGSPVEKSFNLKVIDPVNRAAAVIGDDSSSVIVSLGAQTVLQCYAIGFPAPVVTWWRGSRYLPVSSDELEQRRDHSLVLHSVTLTALGPYTCQAYNGVGRAASWTIILKAIGPAYSQDPNDVTYNQYLVRPPISPPLDHAPRPPPYRPFRTQSPLVLTTTTHLPEPEVTRRIFVVPVTTNITLEKTTFPVGSDISIPCNVDGYPTPRVDWYKDSLLLQSSSRIHISESSRLLVSQANANDTGTYKCEAKNDFGSSDSSVTITVEGVYIHPNCLDKSFFANCKLVVEGSYCTHKYYANFCCKSCTLAGQLPPIGPHLNLDLHSSTNQLYRRRRSLVPH